MVERQNGTSYRVVVEDSANIPVPNIISELTNDVNCLNIRAYKGGRGKGKDGER